MESSRLFPEGKESLDKSMDLVTDEKAEWLGKLDGLLLAFKVKAEELKTELDEANAIVNPSMWRSVFSTKPKPEVVAALKTLLEKINSEKHFENELAMHIEAAQAFHLYAEPIINGMQTYITDGESNQSNHQKASLEVEGAYSELYDSLLKRRIEYNERIKVESRRKAVQQYHQSVTSSERDYSWIRSDLDEVTQCVKYADSLHEESSQLLADLKQESYALPEGIRDVGRVIEGVPEHKEHEQLQDDYAVLMQKIATFIGARPLSLASMEQQVEDDIKSLEKLNKDYQFIERNCDDIKVDWSIYNRIDREIYELLKKEGELEGANEEQIINALQSYLAGNATYETTKALLDGALKKHIQDADSNQAELQALQGRMERFKADLDKVRGEKEKLDRIYNGCGEIPTARISKLEDHLRSQIESFKSFIEDISLLKNKKLKAAVTDNNDSMDLLFAWVKSRKSLLKLEDSESQFQQINATLPAALQRVDEQMSKITSIQQKCTDFSGLLASAKRCIADRNWKVAKKNISQLARERDNIIFNIKRIEEIKSECKALSEDFSVFLAKFAHLEKYFSIEEASFTQNIKRLISSFHGFQLILWQDSKVEEIGGLYALIVDKISSLNQILNNIKTYLQAMSRPDLFDTTSQIISRITSNKRLIAPIVEKDFKGFREHCRKNFSFEKIELLDEENNSMQYPDALYIDLVNLKEKLKYLFKFPDKKNWEAIIAHNSQSVGEFSEKFSQYKITLKQLQENISIYLEHFKHYENRKANFKVISNGLDLKLESIESDLVLLERLHRRIEECQKIISHLQKSKSRITTVLIESVRDIERASAGGSLKLQQIAKAIDKSKEKEKFGATILSLFGKLKNLKEREADIDQEVFVRLRQEYLFTGRSATIINKLKAYGEAKNENDPKKKLIADFIAKLHDFKSSGKEFGDLFSGQNTEDLRVNTGRSAYFGYASTTSNLLDGLRKELEQLAVREEAGASGSIIHSLRQDYGQMRQDYVSILTKKQISDDISSFKNHLDCEEWVANWLDVCGSNSTPEKIAKLVKSLLNAPYPDTLPPELTKKIYRDLIQIHSWVGEEKSDIARRRMRMQFAVLIRLNEAYPRDERLHAQMTNICNNSPFTFTYQLLKSHLEKSKTNREELKQKLWQQLDMIAYGDGSEVEKYAEMKERVLRFYIRLRQKTNGSSGFFVGNGSRLGDALEVFLKYPEALNEEEPANGFTRGFGYDENQVQHRRLDRDFIDKTAHWLSDHIFSCCRPR